MKKGFLQMASRKPHIAITKPVTGNRVSYFCLSWAVRLMGGTPIKITPDTDYKNTSFEGLIISGGTDIDPNRYKSNKTKQGYTYDAPRDEMELWLLEYAENKKIPTLGICRGAQLMNIYRGGTLYFDVSKAFERANYPNSTLARIFYRKRMYIENKDTLIYKILKCTACKVNSIHSQAVNVLGKGLSIGGQEKNGVVQSIEDPTYDFFLGVQFHPEYMTYSAQYRRIFKRLIKCAKDRLMS